MFKKYYLAYGSNLNFEQMGIRCFYAKPIGKAKLKDYRLVFKGRADEFAYLTIEKCKGCSVPVGVYEISHWDVSSLADNEGYPEFYSKHYVNFKIDGRNEEALIYIMNENFDYHLPSLEYVKTCIGGYHDFGFNKKIISKAVDDTIDSMSKTIKKEKNTKKKKVKKYLFF